MSIIERVLRSESVLLAELELAFEIDLFTTLLFVGPGPDTDCEA